VVLNVASVDIYSYNVFNQIHQSFDSDVKYFRDRATLSKDKESLLIDQFDQITIPIYKAHAKRAVDQMLCGLTTINQHISNLLTHSSENLYDPKIKKAVEYFLKQREYYLSIGKIKAKFNDEIAPLPNPPRDI
jgi:hypothetical protein